MTLAGTPMTVAAVNGAGQDGTQAHTSRLRTALGGRIISRTIFASLLLLLFLAPIPYGTVDSWWQALIECAVFALTALWLIDWLLTGRLKLSAHLTLLAPLLALCAFALVQTMPLWPQPTPVGLLRRAISFDPYETRLAAVRLLTLTLALALLLRYTDSPRRLRLLVYTVIGIGLISALFGLTRQVAQRGATGFLLPRLLPNSGYAQFINKNHFAFLAELSLGLLAGLVVGRGVPRQRLLLYGALAIPLWTALVLSNSRGGILAMLCQTLFLGISFNLRPGAPQAPTVPDRANRSANRAVTTSLRLTLVVALLASIVSGMIWLGGDPLATRLASVREEVGTETTEPTHTGRAAIWQASWRLWLAHPITGSGLGGYWMAITAYHDGSGELVPQQAHNDYLELLASGGLIGAALAIWFIAALLKRARRQLADPEPFRRAVALGALTGLFGVAVHSLVDFGLHLTGIALLAVALVVLATNEETQRRLASARPQSKN